MEINKPVLKEEITEWPQNFNNRALYMLKRENQDFNDSFKLKHPLLKKINFDVLMSQVQQ